MKRYWIVLWSLWIGRLVPQPTEPVRVSSGLLRGTIDAAGSHSSYLGIPYARYEHRFQASHPYPSWNGVFDATETRIRCPQRFFSRRISGREDCLTLNVYTPIQRDDELKPVMVFIHGGGFRDGSGSPFLYGPEYLVRHGVILVTFNYRLEVLGFLCLGIKEAPGNVGLKDQVQALRWVKENIGSFGGDSNQITLFGESAGSASVVYHIASPMSKGLFQKAIMQSGSAISPWSLQFEPGKTAQMLAKQMGFEYDDPREIYNLFISKSPKELLETRIPRRKGDVVLSENVFVPCVEKNIPDEEQFLPDIPYNLISKGNYNKVPMIIGYNNAEGLMFVGKENETTISNFNFYDATPRDLEFQNDDEKFKTADKLKEIYNGTKASKDVNVWLSKFEGDSGIVYPVTKTIELFSKAYEPVYAYKLSYDGWLNLIKMMFRFSKYPGTSHADDLFYMFKPNIPLPQSLIETKMIDRITTLWTNFAKYGNPTPEATDLLPTIWDPLNKDDPKLFIIDRDFSTQSLWEDEDIVFWNDTYKKYRRKN